MKKIYLSYEGEGEEAGEGDKIKMQRLLNINNNTWSFLSDVLSQDHQLLMLIYYDKVSSWINNRISKSYIVLWRKDG